MGSRHAQTRLLSILAAALLCLSGYTVHAAVISDNTSNATSGTESASTTRYLAATFKTDSSTHTLSSVTLLLAMTSSTGAAQLAVYSDIGTTASPGLEPGTLLATLTSPGNFTTGLAPNTFTSSGLQLAANTTYWLVLKPTSGTFDWGWSTLNTGTGSGYTNVWGVSEDTGAFWWSSDFYPLQLSVTVDACTSPSIASAPANASSVCGGTAQLAVVAAGTGASYSWSRNGIVLTDSARVSGSTTPTLTISGATRADHGTYTVIVSGSCGVPATASARLTICIADFNCSGSADVQDIFDYLNAWFQADPLTEVNFNTSLDVQDIFDFLNAWFTGC